MKRIALSLVVIFTICHIYAQTLDSIAHHHVGYYGPNGGGQMDNVSQLRDGSVLFLHKEGINMNSTADVAGNVHYKIARYGGILLDTLFVADSDPSFYMFAKNPNNNDNIRVGIVHDTLNMSSFLQIFPFNNNLTYDTLNEIHFLLSDTIVFSYPDGYFFNEQNNLILTYGVRLGGNDYRQHFACYGLDGTLKHENILLGSSIPLSTYLGFGVFNESPMEYYMYGLYSNPNASDHIVCYILDSLFQYKNSFTITEESIRPQLQYVFGWKEQLLVDGDDFIFGSRYKQGTRNGVCLVRYDKHTLEEKDRLLFESKPMISFHGGACPIGLGKDDEGSLYFSYNTQSPILTDKEQIAVVKMDADFNVQWQRFCLEPEGYYRNGDVMTVLDDGGMAVGGGYFGRPEVFFLILSDDGWVISETEITIRPYSYWPNPVQSELYLQYSPDVKPRQIELYDLQGRLVHTQKNGLENINMKCLSSGAYTMRVTMEGGRVFTDKVVKD